MSELIPKDKVIRLINEAIDNANKEFFDSEWARGEVNGLGVARDIILSGQCNIESVPTINSINKGLYSKYTVFNNETGQEAEDCFVLKPSKDIAAREALKTYAKVLEGTLISEHIILWLAELEDKDLEVVRDE